MNYSGPIGYTMEKKNLGPFFTPHTNFNFRSIVDLNMEGKIINIIEDNRGRYLYSH